MTMHHLNLFTSKPVSVSHLFVTSPTALLLELRIASLSQFFRALWIVNILKLGLVNILILDLVEMLMLGWDFEVNA